MKFWAIVVEDKRNPAWNEEYWIFIEAETIEEAVQKAQEKIEALKAEDIETYRFYTIHEDWFEEIADGLLLPAGGG